MHTHIAPADPAEPRLRVLVEALDQYLASLYPAESNHLLDIETLRQPDVVFLALTVDDMVAGCGAIALRDGYVEIKRVYVDPAYRGRRLGHAMMQALEQEALRRGQSLARLETGIYQPEALALYETVGYQYRPPFGDYQADPLSVFMEKRLGEPSRSAPVPSAECL